MLVLPAITSAQFANAGTLVLSGEPIVNGGPLETTITQGNVPKSGIMHRSESVRKFLRRMVYVALNYGDFRTGTLVAS
jgi:hypothetical protein